MNVWWYDKGSGEGSGETSSLAVGHTAHTVKYSHSRKWLGHVTEAARREVVCGGGRPSGTGRDLAPPGQRRVGSSTSRSCAFVRVRVSIPPPAPWWGVVKNQLFCSPCGCLAATANCGKKCPPGKREPLKYWRAWRHSWRSWRASTDHPIQPIPSYSTSHESLDSHTPPSVYTISNNLVLMKINKQF